MIPKNSFITNKLANQILQIYLSQHFLTQLTTLTLESSQRDSCHCIFLYQISIKLYIFYIYCKEKTFSQGKDIRPSLLKRSSLDNNENQKLHTFLKFRTIIVSIRATNPSFFNQHFVNKSNSFD